MAQYEYDDSSLDNIGEVGVKKIIEILRANRSVLGWHVKEYYSDDAELPRTPSVAILYEGLSQDLRSASNFTRRNYTFDLRFSIWYYHSEIEAHTKRSEIMRRANQIANILLQNSSLDGFAPKLGSTVEVVTYRPRMSYSGAIMASALIQLVAKVLCTVQSS